MNASFCKAEMPDAFADCLFRGYLRYCFSGLLEVTAARCKTLGDIMDRCSEEMDLVEAEAAAACETLQKQQERIKARLVSLQVKATVLRFA